MSGTPKKPQAPCSPSSRVKQAQETARRSGDPREKVKTKPVPTRKPRIAQTKPKPKPPARKTTVQRPANRPRRQPGRPAPPKKRVTPKKKPRKVPKSSQKPRGKARPRRR